MSMRMLASQYILSLPHPAPFPFRSLESGAHHPCPHHASRALQHSASLWRAGSANMLIRIPLLLWPLLHPPVAVRPPHSRRSPLALLQHPCPSLAAVRRAPPQSMRESRRSEGQSRARRQQRGCSPARPAVGRGLISVLAASAPTCSRAGHASCCASRAIA